MFATETQRTQRKEFFITEEGTSQPHFRHRFSLISTVQFFNIELINKTQILTPKSKTLNNATETGEDTEKNYFLCKRHTPPRK